MPKSIAESVHRALLSHQVTLGTAESCTGGMIGARITSRAGSSAYFRGGVIAYSNDIKTALLGVGEGMLARHGAVSAPVARAMALGARKQLGCTWSIAVTGVAGPGASERKPAGLVYIAVAGPGRRMVLEECRFQGGRAQVRRQTVDRALILLLELLER